MRGKRSALFTQASHFVSALAVGGFVAGLLLIPNSSRAQTRGDGFLFEPPAGSFTFLTGMAQPRASSDIFSYTRELLTLEKGDFNSLTLGMEYAQQLNDRVDLFGGIGYAGARERSEFRDWVYEDDSPIEQTTRFIRVPMSVGARIYLMERGRAIGRFAWLPTTVAPYVSAGAGAVWYTFEQKGDFVLDDGTIVRDDLVSSGWAPLLHGAAGLDISLSPRVLLATEARYGLARATMQEDFSGFDKIDLAGFTGTVGLKIRF